MRAQRIRLAAGMDEVSTRELEVSKSLFFHQPSGSHAAPLMMRRAVLPTVALSTRGSECSVCHVTCTSITPAGCPMRTVFGSAAFVDRQLWTIVPGTSAAAAVQIAAPPP